MQYPTVGAHAGRMGFGLVSTVGKETPSTSSSLLVEGEESVAGEDGGKGGMAWSCSVAPRVGV